MCRYRYLKIPANWSPEQAWAVVEFLHLLEKLIWETHEEELLELVGPDPPELSINDSCLDSGDDIPF